MSAVFRLTLLLMSLLSSSLVLAHPFKLEAQISHKKIWSSGRTKAYLKVALTGLELKTQRAPVNIAIVIDRSGSMSGERLKQAKQAAKLAVGMLQADDIVSLVTYSSTAQVVVPATKVGSGEMIISAIDGITSNGSTALYAGAQLGGEEVKKFLDAESINRVILLSDGLANIGPSEPTELAELGKELARSGMSVSTIGLGLGYNEDLMVQLAGASDGNHAFVEHPEQLAQIVSLELHDALAVVARDVDIELTFPAGMRPVRALGRSATFDGQVVKSHIKDLITRVERYVLIEVELSSDQPSNDFTFAQVKLDYKDTEGQKRRRETTVTTSRAQSAEEMDQSAVSHVMENVVELIAREQQSLAIILKDKGEDEKAAKLIRDTNEYLRQSAIQFESEELKAMEKRGREDEAVIRKKGKGTAWTRSRKKMRHEAYRSDQQMGY